MLFNFPGTLPGYPGLQGGGEPAPPHGLRPLCLPPEPPSAPGWLSQEPQSLSASPPHPTPAHHFVVDFMEVDFTHFLHDVFALKRDKPEP